MEQTLDFSSVPSRSWYYTNRCRGAESRQKPSLLYISLEYFNCISHPLLNYSFTALSKIAEFFPGKRDKSQGIVGSLCVIKYREGCRNPFGIQVLFYGLSEEQRTDVLERWGLGRSVGWPLLSTKSNVGRGWKTEKDSEPWKSWLITQVIISSKNVSWESLIKVDANCT